MVSQSSASPSIRWRYKAEALCKAETASNSFFFSRNLAAAAAELTAFAPGAWEGRFAATDARDMSAKDAVFAVVNVPAIYGN